MKLAVAVLRISAVAFVAFGLAFALAPDTFADLMTGATPATPSASIDMRATYGGVAFGIGVFYWLTTRRPESVRLGLLALLLVLSALAVARMVGIVVDGEPNAFMMLNLVLEIAGAVLAVITLRQVGSS